MNGDVFVNIYMKAGKDENSYMVMSFEISYLPYVNIRYFTVHIINKLWVRVTTLGVFIICLRTKSTNADDR